MRFLILVASLLMAVVAPAFADAASEYQAGQTAYEPEQLRRGYQALFECDQAASRTSRAYVARGNAYDDNGQVDLGIADYTAAIAMSAKYPDAYSTIVASPIIGKKEYDRGARRSRQGDRIESGLRDQLCTRGNVNDDKGLTGPGARRLLHGDADRSEIYRSYGERGSAYGRLGRFDEAITDLTKGIELNPRYAFAYLIRAQIYEKKNDRDKAIADYRQALALDPARAVARQALQRLGVEP